MKKLTSLLIVIALLCSCAFAEGGMLTLFDAATDLAYNTNNVTLSAEATFSFDGEEFKVMHASYKQDGVNSYLDYMLDTPRADGSVYNGGYRVLGVNDTVYACDTYYGNYYYTSMQYPSDTVLTSDAKVSSMLNLARTLVGCAAPLESIAMDVKDNTYTFKTGALPSFINETAFYLVRDYLMDHYYRNLFNDQVIGHGTYVYYEDYNALLSNLYFKLFNEEMPEVYDDTMQSRMSVVYSWAEQLENEIRGSFDGGYVYIKNDGTPECYNDSTELYLANGMVAVTFQDEAAAVSAYYNEKYGEPISDDMFRLIIYSPNNQLWLAYYNVLTEATDYYTAKVKELNPTAVRAPIMADGSIRTYSNMHIGAYISKTQEISMNVKAAALESLDAVVTTDADGRLSTFNGEASFNVTYTDGTEHILHISFDLGAKDYGTTYVNPQFDAEEYDWVSYDQFIEHVGENYDDAAAELEWDNFIKNAPETMTFAGETYDTLISLYFDN